MTSMRDLTEHDADLKAELERLRAEVTAWRRAYEAGAKREIAFTNSAREVEPLYTALDVADADESRLGVPGAYPFTRGIHPVSYTHLTLPTILLV